MAIEIERKYLLSNDSWRENISKQVEFQQAYLANNERTSVRIRIEGELANINIKSMTLGRSRSEFEYPIPLADAQELINTLCTQPIVSKTRYWVYYAGKCWEIDEFSADNQGLIVAEIELDTEDEREAFWRELINTGLLTEADRKEPFTGKKFIISINAPSYPYEGIWIETEYQEPAAAICRIDQKYDDGTAAPKPGGIIFTDSGSEYNPSTNCDNLTGTVEGNYNVFRY